MRFALVLLLTALLVTPALAKKKKGPGMDELLAELPRCESLETCPAALELIKRGPAIWPGIRAGLSAPDELTRFWTLGILSEVVVKKAIDDNSGLEFSVFAGGTQADSDGPAREFALDNGNNVITLSQEQTDEWRALAQPIYNKWLADMTEKGIDGQALLEEATYLIEKYTPQYVK